MFRTVAVVLLVIAALFLRRRWTYTDSYGVVVQTEATTVVTMMADGMTQLNPFTLGDLSVYSQVGLDAADETIFGIVFD
jgi:hypothetical protein